MLVLVAVAILTYSSLVYFAEREGQVEIFWMIMTLTVTVTTMVMMMMVVMMILVVTVMVTTAIMMTMMAVSILEGIFQDSDRESICQLESKAFKIHLSLKPKKSPHNIFWPFLPSQLKTIFQTTVHG